MNVEINSSVGVVTHKLQDWANVFIDNLPNLLVAIIVMLVSYLVSRFIYRATIKLTIKKIKQTSIAKLVARSAAVLVVLAGLLLSLSALNLGKALTSILAGAGVSGLVVGLALQGTLSNTISGIVLSFRNNIQVGNWIETNGYAGEVMDINLNYFVLKEADNNIVVIPNKQIIENPFKNYSLTIKMRVSIQCGVGYESDLEKVEKLTKDTISEFFDQESIDKQIEFYYTGFEDSSINYLCRFWIEGTSGLDRLKAKSKALVELKKAYEVEGINIPFPIRTLHFSLQHSIKNLNKLEAFVTN
ncbi:mechanosensitive ion channel family protein [Aquimarina sp. D1M17]|uniref:mechanosensitive ion channel family protein n=1 Tax=Aquimarina acroporae TaxID=2937283 RepID=UPI0020C160EA|nr:mechanosensitive ion channel domain-containing protein [Aquimarina acroporae]MCK8521305.1 mechanosensitive ion channel family protein [Aquimarina acroporae]